MSAAALIMELKLDVSERTLIKELAEMNLFHCIAWKRSFLTKIHCQKQLKYALQFKDWTVEDWKHVIWTDETAFHVGMSKRGVELIWREPGEEYHPDCINPTKREATGIMFWGAFRWGKIGLGLFFETPKGQHITAKVYCDQVLTGPLYDFWAESFLDVQEPMIMEDGAPA